MAKPDRDKIEAKHETILVDREVFEVKKLGSIIIACTVFLLVLHAFWADWLWRHDLVDLRERMGRWQINSRLALFAGLILINGVSLMIFWPGVPLWAAQVNAVYHLLLAADEARRIFPRPRANAPRGVFLVNHLMWSALSWMWMVRTES